MDLIAAGRAALLPDDDLTLASVLKSPLIGLDEDALFRLAARRSGSLAEALAASDDGPRGRSRASARPMARSGRRRFRPSRSTRFSSARTAAGAR